ncbi:uncharacterized protein LOC143287338 [Babylonia areolata]|uniref:uncharacterized protein LOC143287338 n=1 Tax=Babylonia areolata TaxID=304850 RepID=UPI003FD1AD29
MGGAHTKEESDMDIPTPYQDSTPPRDPGLFKRQLPFDPRSPTDDIARTPIIVDSTPSELKTIDPRSPTFGIERTPLTVMLAKDDPELQEMEVEDRAPLCQPEDISDADMSTPQKPTVASDLTAVEDLIPHIDAEDTSPLLENAQQQPVSAPDPTPVQPKPVSFPKKLFPVSQPPVAGVKPAPVSRSLGLVARDANSPRTIVQSKQRRQVVKSMGGVGNQIGVDKENIAH